MNIYIFSGKHKNRLRIIVIFFLFISIINLIYYMVSSQHNFNNFVFQYAVYILCLVASILADLDINYSIHPKIRDNPPVLISAKIIAAAWTLGTLYSVFAKWSAIGAVDLVRYIIVLCIVIMFSQEIKAIILSKFK